MFDGQGGKITYNDNVMQLAGRKLMLNKVAPNFLLVNREMEEVDLYNFKDKFKVITSLPSLDTPVCELQAKKFSESASSLSDRVVIIAVSKDLPFAQKRFCIDHDINNLMVLSDYKYSSFGINYGLLVKDLNLLARAVLILDGNNVIKYIQIGSELTDQLDYKDVLNNLNEIIATKTSPVSSSLPIVCQPCSTGVSLSMDVIQDRLKSLVDWRLVDGKRIIKEIIFTSFASAKYFLDLLACVAEEQNHHPTFILSFNKLKIILSTHAANGLTENDFVIAKIVDELNPLP